MDQKKYFFPRFLFTLAFVISLKSQAFTFNNNGAASFKEDEILINVNDIDCLSAPGNSCLSNFTTPQELLDLTEEAINRFWNRIPTTRLTLSRGSLVSSGASYRTGNMCNEGFNSPTCTPNSALKVPNNILISCNCSDGNFGVSNQKILGVTIPNNFEGNQLKGSLILLNAKHSGFFDLTKDEKINVIGHEIGHALGLGHSPVEDSLMYYLNIGKRDRLGWDDLDGISYLYPASQPLSLACGTVSQVSSPRTPSEKKNFLWALFLGFFSIIILSRTTNFFSLRHLQKVP